ncbi:MAG: HAD family hydrolase [Leptospiraceae bacterium]|nr:HAD family hydrolase [Leptospiraceae bacterium]
MKRANQKPDLLVLDLMNTIMFSHDRFGPQENYWPIYRFLGGAWLSEEVLRRIIDTSVQNMEEDYEKPEKQIRFPVAMDYMLQEAAASGLSLALGDRIALNLTFAFQETGLIDDLHKQCLRMLSGRFRIVVLSNLWGIPYFCNRIFSSPDLAGLVEGLHYSSEIGMLKPSREIFEFVLQKHHCQPEQCLMIGDNLNTDIAGARKAGIDGIWLSYGRSAPNNVEHRLDFPDATESLLNL